MSYIYRKTCFKSLKISSTNVASHSLRLTRLLLIFTALITFSIGARQVPCEIVRSESWESPFGHLKTCYMQQIVIDASDYTISTPSDETLEGLYFNHNKEISFLPLETAKKFPNLLGYAAYDCSIKFVKRENFQNLTKLKGIWLADNQIETVFSNTFDGLKSLEVISLSKNRIIHVAEPPTSSKGINLEF